MNWRRQTGGKPPFARRALYTLQMLRLYRDRNPASIPAMKRSPFHPGPIDALPQEAVAALRRIKEGRSITDREYLKLECDELIRPGLRGWMLTDAGQYRLERGR